MPASNNENSLQKRSKQAVARAALTYIKENMILGVGTGSTVNYFITTLAASKIKIRGAVPSSIATRDKLEERGIPIILPQQVSVVPLYIDGADQINHDFEMIKGGGGALTCEKLISCMSKRFICLVDESKYVREFTYPLPIEILPISYSYIKEKINELAGKPVLRKGFKTDSGNIIVDIHDMKIWRAKRVESLLNEWPGLVCNGIFAIRPADIILLGISSGKVTTIVRD